MIKHAQTQPVDSTTQLTRVTLLLHRIQGALQGRVGRPPAYIDTYGGMSIREIEAITVGLEETMDEDMVSEGAAVHRIHGQ